MRWRVLFAVVFVAVVGALIILRDHGYLGGRTAGGPLRIGTAGVSASVKPGQIAGFGLAGRLTGGTVRVQNVRPRLVSPELEVLGPNVDASSCGGCYPASWPPPGAGGTLEGAGLHGDRPTAIMGLRAQRSGVYYALGLIVDYRRGQRRYRDREAQQLCISVSRRQRCNLGYRGPHGARVAQVGGPARYPGAHRLTAHAATYEGPGTYRVRVTLANQTRSVIDVSDLEFDANAAPIVIVTTEPEQLRLQPHGDAVVRLDVAVPKGCRNETTFPRLRARLDKQRRSIPLSLPLRFSC